MSVDAIPIPCDIHDCGFRLHDHVHDRICVTTYGALRLGMGSYAVTPGVDEPGAEPRRTGNTFWTEVYELDPATRKRGVMIRRSDGFAIAETTRRHLDEIRKWEARWPGASR